MVVDTSALMAIVLDEAEADRCCVAIEAAEALAISAGTLAEALLVGERRGVRALVERLIVGLGVEVVPVGAATAGRVADAWRQWGKGRHAAGLNFGDCFAYALARERAWPLLCVGGDFVQTDVTLAV